MKQLWIKTIGVITAMTLSTAIGFAAEPVLPTTKDAKDAAKTQAAKPAAKVDAAKTAVKTEAAKPAAKVDAAKTAAKAEAAKPAAKVNAAKAASKLEPVDINTATDAQLKAIPGIGDAYASKIIAGRPYAKKDQLKSRNILPGPVYDQVNASIVAKQPAKAAKKK